MNGNGAPKLADALQVLEQAVAAAPVEEISALMGSVVGSLERVKMTAYLRLVQKPEPNTGAYLTPAQVAERWNVPKSFVYEAARQKQLESVKLGKKYIRFMEAAVKDYEAKYGG